MINIINEDEKLTMQGDPASLLTELTIIIIALKHELEKKGIPEKKTKGMLLDAFMFAVVEPEHIVKLMMTHTPGEDIEWEEILN